MIKFGTDGIRGIYGETITEKDAYTLGNALTKLVDSPIVAIAYDTRVSSTSLEKAAVFGILRGGGSVINLGLSTTPKLIYLGELLRCDYSLMITASHNEPKYNGIKVIGKEGKIEKEREFIEKYGDVIHNVEKFGVEIIFDGGDYYEKRITRKLKRNYKVAFDLANGGAVSMIKFLQNYDNITPHFLSDENNGEKINLNCGSMSPKNLAKYVVDNNLDCGFAFDGDGDRIIAVDELGNILDGDNILYAFATNCEVNGVVGTMQTNMGLQKKFEELNIPFVRTMVGDHYVCMKMKKDNIDLGGETSGHIIFSDDFIGDGIKTAIRLIEIMKDNKLSKICKFRKYPSYSLDIETKLANKLEKDTRIKRIVEETSEILKEIGRVLIRSSGTEDKLRVLVECEDENIAKSQMEKIKKEILSLCAE